ncbi:MAG TPA: RsmE family RNA methyltransferase [Gemmataceae bacterium]|nr:RsmE family RNA methyltransferase [Gemmataceae bacterium]
MSERYYLNTGLGPGPLVLDGPEAHHLATVCRSRPGDLVCLFNGDGHEYPARVVALERRHVTLEILEAIAPQRELPFRLEVAVPLPKGDRAQFLVEKLTELGVTTFVPLSTRRSVVHPRESRLEKLQRYVIEASKQCGRNVLMTVEPLADWETYCCRDGLPEVRVLAHPGGSGQCGAGGAADTVALAVGPEGGFTEEEAASARAVGWRTLDLGPRILRVETAAIVLATWAIGARQGLGAATFA